MTTFNFSMVVLAMWSIAILVWIFLLLRLVWTRTRARVERYQVRENIQTPMNGCAYKVIDMRFMNPVAYTYTRAVAERWSQELNATGYIQTPY